MASNERRRHVRVKPTSDLPVRVALAGDGLVRESLDVMDLSVGGLALSSPALANTKPGERLRLHLTLGTSAEQVIEVVTRWISPEGAGVELVDPSARTAQDLSRYIAELLERGGSS
jgi:PilZ domain